MRALLKAIFAISLAALSAVSFADPPGRVARLSELTGDVQLGNSYAGWQSIGRNYPVTSGDSLWVANGGRAELDVGAQQLWIAGGSTVSFDQLDDTHLVARLSSGALSVRVRSFDANEGLHVLTPDGEVILTQPGLYFVAADGQRQGGSAVITRSGRAEVDAGTGWSVEQGMLSLFDRNGPRQEARGYDRLSNNLQLAGFEAWAVSRDNRYDRWTQTTQTNYAGASPYMVGVQELGDYGRWDTNYEYGRVWFPTAVGANWAPYRNGHWSFVQPWGWTWVDDAAWGFAPFHYGRWVQIGPRWAWAPGDYRANGGARPVYAPALVAFFGGNGWSVSANVGPSYSWAPLGWGEPFAPWYATSTPDYWRSVNRPYVRDVSRGEWRPDVYQHSRNIAALTVVSSDVFTRGRPVAQNYVRGVREEAIRSAPPTRITDIAPQMMGRSAAPSATAHEAIRQRPSQSAQSVQAVQNAQTPQAAQPQQNTNPAFIPNVTPMSKDPRERAQQRAQQPMENYGVQPPPQQQQQVRPNVAPVTAPIAAPNNAQRVGDRVTERANVRTDQPRYAQPQAQQPQQAQAPAPAQPQPQIQPQQRYVQPQAQPQSPMQQVVPAPSASSGNNNLRPQMREAPPAQAQPARPAAAPPAQVVAPPVSNAVRSAPPTATATPAAPVTERGAKVLREQVVPPKPKAE